MKKEVIYQLKDKIKVLFNGGFFHIFGSSFINQVISFLSSFILVRVLSKDQYGAYSYALNLYSFFYLFSGLGMVSATLQLCSEKETTKDSSEKVYSYGFKTAIKFNICLTILLVLFAIYGPIKLQSAKGIVMLFSVLIPLMVVFELLQTYFRYKLENKKFSYFTTINSILVLCCSVIGALIDSSKGLVFGRIIGYCITLCIGILKFKFPIKLYLKKITLSIEHKKELLSIGIISMLNMATGQLLYLIDVFVVGQVVAESTIIAEYKVATIIPNALLFIPSSLMIYYFPLFTQNKDDFDWVKRTYIQIIKWFGLINSIIVVGGCLGSKIIMHIVFGKQYVDNSNIFCVLLISYFFSATFRKVIGNILVTQRKLQVNFWIGIMEGIINIGLNFILVNYWGAIGAALATLIVAVISSLFSITYMYFHLKNGGKRND